MSGNWLIKLENVTISYRIDKALAKKLKVSRVFTPLSGINFTVEEGEFISISGPNGSGKTSILKVMSGLMNPFKGVVHRRVSNFGFINQDQVLLPELSLGENILLPYLLKNEEHDDRMIDPSFFDVSMDDLLDKLERYTKRFKIHDILDKKPQTCSLGQQQRALLTRALIMDCDLIFADEPEQNLDSDGKIELFTAFEEANKDFHKTIVLVTQEHPSVLKRFVTRGIKIAGNDLVEIINSRHAITPKAG